MGSFWRKKEDSGSWKKSKENSFNQLKKNIKGYLKISSFFDDGKKFFLEGLNSQEKSKNKGEDTPEDGLQCHPRQSSRGAKLKVQEFFENQQNSSQKSFFFITQKNFF